MRYINLRITYLLTYPLRSYASDFVMNWIEVRAVWQPQIWHVMNAGVLRSRKLTVSCGLCGGHCPAERWRTRLRADMWRIAAIVTFCANRRRSPEVDRGDCNLFGYCTSAVEASNNAENVRIITAFRKYHNQTLIAADTVILHYV